MSIVTTPASRYVLKKLTEVASKAAYSSSVCTYEEIKIPVPWGHIAGKWWGPQDRRPILGLHGWQDNCGTFDRLAPYLIPHKGFLAIDFPGHGLSSQLPAGVYQHAIDYVVTVRRIVQYFNWNKVSLLGHSWGGATGYLYALFYPDNMDFLICLDGLKPLIFNVNEINSINKNIDTFLKYDHLNNNETERPSYSFHELEHRLHAATDQSIDLENCKYILHRNIRPTNESDKFYFNMDVRLKVLSLKNWPKDVITRSAHRFLCPTLMSYSSKRISFYEQYMQAQDLIDIIKKANKNFKFHKVEGTHHVHLNHPERLEGLLNKFIEKYSIEDRSLNGINQKLKIENYK